MINTIEQMLSFLLLDFLFCFGKFLLLDLLSRLVKGPFAFLHPSNSKRVFHHHITFTRFVHGKK